MALTLTTEQIDAEAFARWGEMKGAPLALCRGFARAIEAEVRKQDDALIRQLVDAVQTGFDQTCSVGRTKDFAQLSEALVAGRARLKEAP